MISDLVYFYLLSPLHTGGTTQEGNLLGIARESHTNLPYVPSSTIRGRLRASTNGELCSRLFGTDLNETQDLVQGGHLDRRWVYSLVASAFPQSWSDLGELSPATATLDQVKQSQFKNSR